ncbi:MAG: SAM-dependent methyltransferase [Chitinophagaceae bacterium]|jgi:16S rRNA (cytidine1402-2'-O)-methyltransferase|nr:SAM-dependent methyltransferase [Chitinophagaceae bacterium]
MATNSNVPEGKKPPVVYLIPCALYPGVNEVLPAYVLSAVQACTAFFVENERTARRFLKAIWPQMVIDNYTWVNISKPGPVEIASFARLLKGGSTVGILSEAGCPGVADPGQLLVAEAHRLQATIRPLVGPNSLLLALMASGLNGQLFRFSGYLPIEAAQRRKTIRLLEAETHKEGTTQLFIETPYRNDALLKDLVETCSPHTLLCVAADLTAPAEWIKTLPVKAWKQQQVSLHKRPAIFLLGQP